jgi:hypothetical protein
VPRHQLAGRHAALLLIPGLGCRCDLLVVDRSGRLVVIELKRTETGGHMMLQAIRYAATEPSMGFPDVLDAYTAHRCESERVG